MQQCRLCLGQDRELVDIFITQRQEVENAAAPLHVRLQECLHLDILQNDNLPRWICRQCLDRVDDFTRFRERCLENERALREANTQQTLGDSQKPRENVNSIYDLDTSDDEDDDDEPEIVVVNPMRDYESSNQSLQNGMCDDAGDEEPPEENDDLFQPATNDAQHPSAAETMNTSAADAHAEEELDGSGDAEEEDDEEDEMISVYPAGTASNGLERPTEGQSRNDRAHEAVQKTTVFTCKYCDVAFAASAACQLHEMQDHDLLAPYACHLCNYRTAIRLSLIAHLREIHSIPRPYICVQCGKGFVRRSDLKKHTFVHTGVRPYACQQCGKSFSRNTNLTKHMRIHLGVKPHSCNSCPRTFVNKADLVRHRNVHLSTRTAFTCAWCGNAYARKDNLQHHEVNCSSRRHATSAPPLLPPQVNENHLFAYGGLNSDPSIGQMASGPPQHSAEPTTTMDRSKGMDSTLNASATLASFANIIPMQMMGESATGVGVPGARTGAEMPPSNKVYDCPSCPKRFLSKATLRKHQQTHPQRPDPGYECPQCQKHLPGKRELERHLMTHLDHKPFACKTCGKRFLWKDKLQRHERIHRETRHFGCPNCGATFQRRTALATHLKIDCTASLIGREQRLTNDAPYLLPPHSMLP
ncbi:zinc finger protein 883-like [Anopheles albimanus]|nr:zinc finger protein 883-like [Anopheles albimanus]